MKRPFMNRIEYSKLKIESKISDLRNENKTVMQYEDLFQSLIEKLMQNQLQAKKDSKENTEQSEYCVTERSLRFSNAKENRMTCEDESEDEKEVEVPVENYFAEWQGRDKDRVFKNSTNMQEQFDRVFNKKLGLTKHTKKKSCSYRKQQKLMLQRVYNDLKDPNNNFITFQQMYKFFENCKLFFTIYGISSAELQDIVSCSAHTYPDKLTKEEFFQLFLVNTHARVYEELDNDKVEKMCCMDQGNWQELRSLFNQLDTFGCGTIKTKQFFHKMKTVSASKELLDCKTIAFNNIDRYYSFSKVLFELEHKKQLPEDLQWAYLQNEIINFSHIELPTLDEIVSKKIKNASILDSDTNTFLLKEETLKLLKNQFLRCPKFNQHFVKCQYFCDQILNLDSIMTRSRELVRNCPNTKGFINLLANIRLLRLQGPQYFDMDEMLSYFSVNGFQAEIKQEKLRKSFDAQSTTSEEEWEEQKKEEMRAKRMKSLDHMDKVMKNMKQNRHSKQDSVPVFKPVRFQQFNLTKSRDYMTIRQRKVREMIKEKQCKQLSQIKPFVPANPIPASINGQRYSQDQAKQQIKRQLQKEIKKKQREKDEKNIRYLMSNTKLFEKRDPLLVEEEKRMCRSPLVQQEFQAKPISWFIKERNLLEIIESEKQEKRKNRLRQTKEKYVFGYWRDMPNERKSKFKKLTIAKNLQTCRNTDESLQFDIETFDNLEKEKQKNLKPKTTVVPDFAKLQKQFMQELQAKKKMRSPTVVRQFNLSVSRKKEPQIAQEKVFKKASPPKKIQNDMKSQQPVIVNTTKKFEGMVELTQRKMSQKRYEVHAEKIQEKERKKKEKIFAKLMRKAIQNDSHKYKTESLKLARKNNHQQKIEHERELKKMYERVLNRPFLFQTVSEGQQIKKKGARGCKKGKPQKIRIPLEQNDQKGFPIIPPLNYIQEEDQDYDEGDYGEEMDDGEFIAKDSQNDSGQDYDEGKQFAEATRIFKMKKGFQRSSELNQSF